MKTELNSDPRRDHFRAAIALRPQCEDEHLDDTLINILVERRGYFLRYLQGRLGNWDDAEDIFQDFQLRVLLKAGQIKDANSIMSWLRAVLRSVLADYFRRRASEQRAHRIYGVERTLIFPQDEEATVEEETFERFTCNCLYRLLPKLKAEYTDVLSRVDLKEQSRASAAGDLGISTGNLRVRLYRARQALKDALRHSCPQCRQRRCWESCELKAYPDG